MRKSTPLLPRTGATTSNANANANVDSASRRMSNFSNASNSSSNTNDPAAARYSWHGDADKTRVLLRLVSDVLANKPEGQRRVTTSEWEILLDAFNRDVLPPAESVRVLHNRFTNLRAQCKEYHLIVAAQRSGHLDSVDAWVGFLHAHPGLRKWRKKPFAFYDEMAECLRLHGEDLDNPQAMGDGGGEETMTSQLKQKAKIKENGNATGNGTGIGKRRRVVQSPPSQIPNAPGGVVTISHYPAALRQLAALGLELEDRVDAKRFLVADANAQAFIYMDNAERRFFLQKYCFSKRSETTDANANENGNANANIHRDDADGDGDGEGDGDVNADASTSPEPSED